MQKEVLTIKRRPRARVYTNAEKAKAFVNRNPGYWIASEVLKPRVAITVKPIFA